MRPASDAPCTLFCPRSGCRPVPGRPIWPVISASAMRQRALSVPCTCCDTPMPHRIIEARNVFQCLGIDAANGRHGFGAVALDVLLQLVVADGAAGDEGFVHQAFM